MTVGYLDEATTDWVRGWATGEQGSVPELTLEVNGIRRQTFKPDSIRPDLINIYGEKPLGFDLGIELPAGASVAVKFPDGQHLHGSPAAAVLKPTSSRQKLLSCLTKENRILEIGPSFNPMAPKRDGWDSYSLDHANQDELVKKYGPDGQPVHQIEDADFLWHDGDIESAIPQSLWGTFKACIASHVIEHIPNPIGFYHSIDRLLAPNGVVLLVVPDKRYMFDFFKPHSSTSQLIDASRHNRTRHTKTTAFDNCAMNCKVGDTFTWAEGARLIDLSFFNDIFSANNAYSAGIEDRESPYVDWHGWVYTPASFRLIMLELNALGLIPFVTRGSYSTFGCEFYCSLMRGRVDTRDLDQERLALHKAIIMELAEQAEALKA